MPISPLSSNTDNPTCTLKLAGTPIRDEYLVLAIEIQRELFDIPKAWVSFLLPFEDESNKTFSLSEEPDMAPDTEIEILLGYHGDKQQVAFKGIIESQIIVAPSGERPRLILECSDRAFRMTLEQKCTEFEDMEDSAIIRQLVQQYPLSAKVDASLTHYEKRIQSNVTDWDFLSLLATSNEALLYAEHNTVFVQQPDWNGHPELVVTYGQDMFDFDGQTNLHPKSRNPPNTTQQRLIARNGSVTFPGHASPRLNNTIQLKGLGKRFDGNPLITAIYHDLQAGSWKTTVEFGG